MSKAELGELRITILKGKKEDILGEDKMDEKDKMDGKD